MGDLEFVIHAVRELPFSSRDTLFKVNWEINRHTGTTDWLPPDAGCQTVTFEAVYRISGVPTDARLRFLLLQKPVNCDEQACSTVWTALPLPPPASKKRRSQISLKGLKSGMLSLQLTFRASNGCQSHSSSASKPHVKPLNFSTLPDKTVSSGIISPRDTVDSQRTSAQHSPTPRKPVPQPALDDFKFKSTHTQLSVNLTKEEVSAIFRSLVRTEFTPIPMAQFKHIVRNSLWKHCRRCITDEEMDEMTKCLWDPDSENDPKYVLDKGDICNVLFMNTDQPLVQIQVLFEFWDEANKGFIERPELFEIVYHSASAAEQSRDSYISHLVGAMLEEYGEIGLHENHVLSYPGFERLAVDKRYSFIMSYFVGLLTQHRLSKAKEEVFVVPLIDVPLWFMPDGMTPSFLAKSAKMYASHHAKAAQSDQAAASECNCLLM